MHAPELPQYEEKHVIPNPTMIQYKNNPKLSKYEVDGKFNDRRLNLLPDVEDLIKTDELFAGKEVSVEFAHTGVSSLVCFVETDGEKYVLKVPLSLSDGGDSEARFLKEWEAVGVSVPHVFREGKLGDHAVTIMEFVDAPSLTSAIADGSVKGSVYTDMGEMLARMHTPVTEGYGRIIAGEPEHRNFKDWLLGEDIQKRVRAVQELNLLGDEHGPINTVFDNLLEYSDRQRGSSYCHFDFGPHNILATEPLTVLDPSPILNHGIIDIGRSLLAVPFGDIPSVAGEQLKEGYFGARTGFDHKALQAAIILNAYWKFPYAHKKGRTEAMEKVREYLIETRHLL